MSTTSFSLDWHRECLNNKRASAARYEAEIARLQERLTTLQAEITFYQLQINTAVIHGEDKFDPERFLKGRRSIRARLQHSL